VANRRGLTAELTARIAHAQRYDEPGALLVLDLDGFKEINDREGHQAGDELLARTAATLRSRLRTSDFVARLGGDEFAIILPHAGPAAARQVADAVLTAIRALTPGGLSASCGVAVYDGRVGDADALLGAADTAMYEAKAQGRDRVSVVQAPTRG
jgi:diguanylate cyclase (GGDEF)-like protein